MEKWLEIGNSVNVMNEKPQPLVLGRDLIPLGIKPGPEMGILLDSVYQEQLDGTITSKEEGIEWLKNRLDTEPTGVTGEITGVE